MMNKREFIFGGVAIATSAAGPEIAQAAEYVVLGKRNVRLLNDHDRIFVGLHRGLFSRIRLSVRGNSIFMERLTVTFVNGETADLPVRLFIANGSRTRDILLPGIIRAIRHVDLHYRRVLLGGRATVTVIGKRL